ncbi:MAG: DUF177 domain-containing protein [Oscillospiraceae bacterium]|nr:DUF177 domain-containing protein [Candidatus Ruminococcus equi]
MLFELKEVFLTFDTEKETEYELDMSNIELDGIYPFTSPVSVFAKAQNRAGIVTLDLKVNFEYTRPCDRCFEDVKTDYSFDFSHKLIESLCDDDDDYIETPNMSVELDDLVASDILLNLPTKYLCKGDCQGLCQKCGHNLNNGDCECDKQEIDPRLEALKQFFE